MDTSSFFNYPTLPSAREIPAHDIGLLPHATGEEWDALLDATEALRFHPGDVVLRAGERDRAVYLLLDGRLVVEGAATGVGPPELGRLRSALGARPAAGPHDPAQPRRRSCCPTANGGRRPSRVDRLKP